MSKEVDYGRRRFLAWASVLIASGLLSRLIKSGAREYSEGSERLRSIETSTAIYHFLLDSHGIAISGDLVLADNPISAEELPKQVDLFVAEWTEPYLTEEGFNQGLEAWQTRSFFREPFAVLEERGIDLVYCDLAVKKMERVLLEVVGDFPLVLGYIPIVEKLVRGSISGWEKAMLPLFLMAEGTDKLEAANHAQYRLQPEGALKAAERQQLLSMLQPHYIDALRDQVVATKISAIAQAYRDQLQRKPHILFGGGIGHLALLAYMQHGGMINALHRNPLRSIADELVNEPRTLYESAFRVQGKIFTFEHQVLKRLFTDENN